MITTAKRIQHGTAVFVGLLTPIAGLMLLFADGLDDVLRAGLLFLGLAILLYTLARPDAPTPRPSWQTFRAAFLAGLPELRQDPAFAGELAAIAVSVDQPPPRPGEPGVYDDRVTEAFAPVRHGRP